MQKIPSYFPLKCVSSVKEEKAHKASHTNGFKGSADTKSKNVYPLFLQKQAHGTRCRRRSVNGTVSRNGSSQFSDAYSCDFKQLDLSNLCRKSCKNPFFHFLANRKKCPPIFSLNRKKCPPIFTKNCFKTVIHLLLCKLSKVLCYNGFIRFLRYLACARARARTHAEMFLVRIT